MTECIWLNGEIMPLSAARVGVEDRGFQFADGVYEVIRVYNGRTFTLDEHLGRLERSAEGIQLQVPLGRESLAEAIRRLIGHSHLREGMIYLQLTRGVAARAHAFPPDAPPTLLFYTRELPPIPIPGSNEGVKLISVADERWKRCWIKAIALLPNILAKNDAINAGCDEAVFVENGIASECSASNLFAVIGGKLVTHTVGSKVLPGITRGVILELAENFGIEVDERPLRESEAIRADELFVTSTTREISWVARWGERYIGQGRCGPITLRLHRAYQERVRQSTIIASNAAAVA